MKTQNNKPDSFLKKLTATPASLAGCVLFFSILCFAVFADFIAPYHYDLEDRLRPYEPPTPVHWREADGEFHLFPFVHILDFSMDENHGYSYSENFDRMYPLRLFIRGDTYRFWGIWETNWHLFGVEAPAKIHLLGTDGRGRDLFSRILIGSRISLSVGLVGIFISLMVGSLIGGISGYFGGKADQLLMRLAEIFMMVPAFYLLLAIRSALPLGLNSIHVYFLITYVLGLIGWAPLARVVRGMVLSIKQEEFVLAAKLSGTGHLKIITRHILPHTFSYLIIAAVVSLPGYLVAESALSLLGLGIQEPYVSWGMLLSESLSITQLHFHFWMVTPAVFIFITVFSFNLIGDRLREM